MLNSLIDAGARWNSEVQTMERGVARPQGQSKSKLKAGFNYILHLMARNLPGGYSTRPFLHRLRGVTIGRGVWIGEDVFLDGGYPESIEIRENAAIAMRCTVVGHTKGAGRVIIGKGAVIGAGSLIICSSNKTLTIGEGAVVSAGSTVCNDIPPYTLCGPPRVKMFAKVTVPFLEASSSEDFRRGLRPLRTPMQEVDPHRKTEKDDCNS
jgi:acetyltransferase-like isoleucine patch superfamily enzyme